jgi:hypothetical protein
MIINFSVKSLLEVKRAAATIEGAKKTAANVKRAKRSISGQV